MQRWEEESLFIYRTRLPAGAEGGLVHLVTILGKGRLCGNDPGHERDQVLWNWRILLPDTILEAFFIGFLISLKQLCFSTVDTT